MPSAAPANLSLTEPRHKIPLRSRRSTWLIWRSARATTRCRRMPGQQPTTQSNSRRMHEPQQPTTRSRRMPGQPTKQPTQPSRQPTTHSRTMDRPPTTHSRRMRRIYRRMRRPQRDRGGIQPEVPARSRHIDFMNLWPAGRDDFANLRSARRSSIAFLRPTRHNGMMWFGRSIAFLRPTLHNGLACIRPTRRNGMMWFGESLRRLPVII